MRTLTINDSQPESAGTLEQTLLNCVHEQSAVFDSAVVLIEQLESTAKERHPGEPDSIVQLQKSLARVVGAQEKVSRSYELFMAAKIAPSPTLRNVLASHKQTLKNLVTRINSLQNLFESIRNEISPDLDTDVRRRQMHSAYQKSLKTI